MKGRDCMKRSTLSVECMKNAYFFVLFFWTSIIYFFFFFSIFSPKRPILNLGVWMPADYHLLPPNIDIAGRFSTGRFGWFIPKQLIDTDEVSSIISYRIFKNSTTNQFNRFLFDENILKQL